MSKSRVIVLDQALVKSAVWLQLSGTAKSVYLIFRCKCQIETIRGKPGKRRRVIVNDGKIVFTYDEARKRYCMSSGTFRRAIDELREKGFIDIAASGQGVHKVTSLYSISDRWRLYETKEYEKPKPRRKGPVNRGFQKGNNYGRNCKKRKS